MTSEEQFGVITEQGLARARSQIGKVWEPPPDRIYFNTQATRDTIRHFCEGMGYTNPLFSDPSYAKKTKFGRLVAPGCFLYSVYHAAGHALSMPGVHSWHAGNDWEWYRPILEGDEITYQVALVDVVEKPSRMAGRSVISYCDTIYKNQKGEAIAKTKGWLVWAERGRSKEKGKYRDLPRASYSREELERIESDYDKERIWGATPHYWEDVMVGEDLTPVVKGPLSLRDTICWMMGAGAPFMYAHGRFLTYKRRHPAIGMTDASTGLVDVPVLVHIEPTRAGEVGVAGAYDFGPQRISWLGQLLTNWMGNDGFLKKLYGELRLFNRVGDTTWCKGKVTKKYLQEGEHLVDIECWTENQRGEVTMPGKATVVLPSKESS